MPDIQAAQAILTSLGTAFDMSRALVDIRDGAKFNGMVMDLQRQIMDAQKHAIAAQTDYASALRQLEELRSEIGRLKSWADGKSKFGLREVSQGAFAYIPIRDQDSSEPAYWLCVPCFDRSERSILQILGPEDPNGGARGRGYMMWGCPHCKSQIRVLYTHNPNNQSQPSS